MFRMNLGRPVIRTQRNRDVAIHRGKHSPNKEMTVTFEKGVKNESPYKMKTSTIHTTQAYTQPHAQPKPKSITYANTKPVGGVRMSYIRKTGMSSKDYHDIKRGMNRENNFKGVWTSFLKKDPSRSGGCGSCGGSRWG